ncbi:MAG: YeeE/YedE thiosulfate transporter family protein [Limisphaerales bacterium]
MRWRTKDGGWSPYLAGALAGLLAVLSAWLTTVVAGKTSYLGTSTTFVRAVGLAEGVVASGHVAENEYFTKEKVRVDWQFMVVVGILAGALVSAKMDGSYAAEAVPPVWRERFGGGVGKRAAWGFAGGVVALFGVRLADGCPSGHGLSGLMQLSGSGFLAMLMFFGVGIGVARLVYGRANHE